MTYETETVTVDELDANQQYFERLYLLDQVGELDSDDMMQDEVIADHADHEDQVRYDLDRLEESVDDLPDEYGRLFRDIDGFSHQLDDIRGIDISRDDTDPMTPSEAVDEIKQYVEEGTEVDEELGYDVDDVTRLFYARHWENHLRQRHGIEGELDPTYVLDVLE